MFLTNLPREGGRGWGGLPHQARPPPRTSDLVPLARPPPAAHSPTHLPTRPIPQGAAPQGVDVFFDNVGGSVWAEALKTVSWGAHVLVVGFASGTIPSLPTNLALVKNLTVHGVFWGSYMTHDPKVLRGSLDALVAALATHRHVGEGLRGGARLWPRTPPLPSPANPHHNPRPPLPLPPAQPEGADFAPRATGPVEGRMGRGGGQGGGGQGSAAARGGRGGQALRWGTAWSACWCNRVAMPHALQRKTNRKREVERARPK